jgi:uncharacterized protein
MMNDSLPKFIYHDDPVRSGVIVPSDTHCLCCEQARGYIYSGPVYGDEDLDDGLCPWCIADGSARAKFGASFTDEQGVGGYGAWESVSEEVVKIVAYRTPGFIGWQQEQWWTHCADAAIFIEVVGYEELQNFGEQAIAAIAEESGFSGEELEEYMKDLHKSYGPTAYVFQCRHCGQYGGYSDCH